MTNIIIYSLLRLFKQLQPFCHNHLTNSRQFVNNAATTPHCVGRFGDLNFKDAQPRFAVFLCVLHGYVRVMASRVGTSKDVLVALSQFANPARFVTHVWRRGWQVYNLLSKRYIMANGFQHNGVWSFKLPDPFNRTPYYPLTSKQMAELLDISDRTALRVCKSESKLSKAELVFLQMHIFGYIPDPDLLRYGVSFRKGYLYSHDVPEFEMSAGEFAHLYLWKEQYLHYEQMFNEAQQRVKAIEQASKTNVINFQQAVAKRQQHNNLGA